jgi:heme exporter protein C
MKLWRWLWLLVTLGVLAEGFRVAMFVVPPDSQQGNVQRIFYYHIPSWAGMGLFFAINLACSLVYLAVRNRNHALAMKTDSLAVASAEMGVVFCLIGLVTGSLWGRAVWGIWWTWDARLTSTFVMWLLYVSYLLLRTLIEEPDRRALLSSLYGIFAFLDVPLVFGSIRWWRTQHPQPVVMGGPGSGLDPTMFKVLMFSWLAMLTLMSLVMRQRYRLEAMSSEVEAVRHELEAA